MADGIVLDISLSENVSAALDRGIAAASDLTPAMGEIARYLAAEARFRFETETGPDGRAWKPSERAKADGGQTLSLSGDLKSSIGERWGADFAEAGPEASAGAAVYAAIHQFGGTIRAKNGKALSFGGRLFAAVTIPARPYLGFGPDDEAPVLEILADHLGGAFDGAAGLPA